MRLADPGIRLTLGKADKAAARMRHRKRIHPKVVLVSLDSDVAIIDKEPGLLSVPTPRQEKTSALEILEGYLNDRKGELTRRRFFGSPDPVKAYPVHRLDQYTSGLLCFAFNEDARQKLIAQLRSHHFQREYIAYGDGLSENPNGSWVDYLQLSEDGMDQQVIEAEDERGGATQATTHYSVQTVFEPYNVSKLRIRLETGLKHQIRIQAAAHGMPLVGDRLYHEATRKALRKKGASLPYHFRRQALHACLIGIKHPTSQETLRVESNLPGDLQDLEARLKLPPGIEPSV